MHAAVALPNQNPMIFPEGDFMRVVGEIKGNLAACVGNLTITIKGKLLGVEFVIDTLVIAASGLSIVISNKIVDIRGLHEVKGEIAYVDAGGRGVTTQVYVGVPYKQD